MSSTLIARCGRASGWFCLAALSLLNVACSGGGNSDRGVNTAVGTSAGVAITTSTGSTQMLAGETLVLTAAVTNDKNNAGVRWVLDGDGALSSVTTTSATYTAPASVVGTSTPFITAASVADATQGASATLVVAGDPVIDPAAFFPANVSSVYSASVVAVGGKAPFVWTVSGTLPAGITASGSTLYFETLSGTPTATGSYPLQLTVTDANSKTATANIVLAVNPASPCQLSGQYAVLVSGLSGGALATRAMSLNVASDGTITGILDRKSGSTTTAAQTLTGSCGTFTANAGFLALTGSSDSPGFNYALASSLGGGRVQLTNGGDSSSASGLFYQQTPAAFTLASIAGNYALGLQGAEAAADRRFGLIGQLTISANGAISAGRVDTNGSTALNSSAAIGSMTAPDSSGRGTLTLTAGSQSFNLAYYVVNASRLLLVNIDSGASAPRLSGFMTRQQPGIGSTSLAGSGVLSLWGSAGNTIPSAVLSVGRLSGANSSTGTISLLLDTADRGNTLAGLASTAGTFGVESDGRATVLATISGVARNFGLYLDAASNGYVIERGSSTGNAGLLEVQMAAPFSRSMPGQFVSGSQFPQSSTPLIMSPANFISGGSISSGSTSGVAAIDVNTGRGLGSISSTGLAASNIAFYVVQPNKAVMLRFGFTNQNPSIDWYIN